MVERSPKDPAAALAPLLRLANEAAAGLDAEAELARTGEKLLASLDRSATVLPLARRPSWLLIAATLGALAIALFFAWPRHALDYSIDGARVAERYVFAGPSGAQVRFSEGTEIQFEAGARGRIGEVTAHGARVSIEAGRANFRVMHLPAAAWVTEAGPFTIAVTGTEFDVTWRDEQLEVEVRVGSVVVTGPLAQNGVPLIAGQRLIADVSRAELRLSAIAGAPLATAAGASSAGDVPHAPAPPLVAPSALPSASNRVEPSAPAPAPPSWRARVASGDFAGVLADADARGLDAAVDQAPLSELAALADAARYAGRSELARRALTAERSRFSGSAEARSAAFLLGRMTEPSSRSAAIGWYDQYLNESPNGALASEALGRKMLLLKSTSPEAARPAAEAYLHRFPSGALRSTAEEILGSATPASPASSASAP